MSRRIIRNVKYERRNLMKITQEAYCWLKRRGISLDVEDFKVAKENLSLFETFFNVIL